MKKIMMSVVPLLFMVSMLNAQQPDSTNVGQKAKTDKPGNESEFVDNNSNGIDDRLERERQNEEKRGNRRRDHFVDKDGDGISDNREGDIMGRGGSGQRKSKGRK